MRRVESLSKQSEQDPPEREAYSRKGESVCGNVFPVARFATTTVMGISGTDDRDDDNDEVKEGWG